VNIAPVCGYMKADGIQCGSPAMRGHRFCFHHHRWHEEGVILSADRAGRVKSSLDLSALGNAKTIQLSITQVMHQLLTGEIDHKTASVLLYALQTATINLRNFAPDPNGQVDRDAQTMSASRIEEDSLSEHRLPADSANERSQNPRSSGA
jgi:hypothetical protein